MKLVTLLFVAAGMAVVAWAIEPPAPIVIHERTLQGQLICADYTSASAPRTANRSCVEASIVRGWLLQNGRPDECE